MSRAELFRILGDPNRLRIMTLLGAEAPIEVDRLAILVPSGTVERLDYTNAGTRSQDHNSSRSNKTNTVWVDDDFGDDEDADTAVNTRFHFSWDGGAVCEELPCPSNGRPDGAISSLTIYPGDALDDDDRLAMTWGETTPMKEEFTGYASLNCKGCYRGHVTVLKVAATDDGDIDVTSAMGAEAVTAYAGDTVVYSGKLDACATHFGTIAGTTGSSWPKGMSVEETAIGTLISLTW